MFTEGYRKLFIKVITVKWKRGKKGLENWSTKEMLCLNWVGNGHSYDLHWSEMSTKRGKQRTLDIIEKDDSKGKQRRHFLHQKQIVSNLFFPMLFKVEPMAIHC